MHNEGYSTMCGHAVIALGRYAVDRGLVTRTEPETRMVIQCPCGPVTVRVEVQGGSAGRVAFESVPAFAPYLDLNVHVEGHGPVTCDIGYGGAFYAVADAGQFGLQAPGSPVADLVAAAGTLSQAVRRRVELIHPDSDDLGFLYGSILTDGREDGSTSANVCVFADSQVDRSPTGSGVTARMAIRHAKGLLEAGREYTFESITGSTMTGRIVGEQLLGSHGAVTVEVGGRTYYTGAASFVIEPNDPFQHGFLVR